MNHHLCTWKVNFLFRFEQELHSYIIFWCETRCYWWTTTAHTIESLFLNEYIKHAQSTIPLDFSVKFHVLSLSTAYAWNDSYHTFVSLPSIELRMFHILIEYRWSSPAVIWRVFVYEFEKKIGSLSVKVSCLQHINAYVFKRICSMYNTHDVVKLYVSPIVPNMLNNYCFPFLMHHRCQWYYFCLRGSWTPEYAVILWWLK